MGDASGVAIEPAAQTRLLDSVREVPGVLAVGVPGAGGCDAVFCLVIEGRGAEEGVEDLWSAYAEVRVTRLPVQVGAGRGQPEAGVRIAALE